MKTTFHSTSTISSNSAKTCALSCNAVSINKSLFGTWTFYRTSHRNFTIHLVWLPSTPKTFLYKRWLVKSLFKILKCDKIIRNSLQFTQKCPSKIGLLVLKTSGKYVIFYSVFFPTTYFILRHFLQTQDFRFSIHLANHLRA